MRRRRSTLPLRQSTAPQSIQSFLFSCSLLARGHSSAASCIQQLTTKYSGPVLDCQLSVEATSYLALNRPDDAKKAIEHAQERKLEGDFLHQEIYYVAFYKGEAPEME